MPRSWAHAPSRAAASRTWPTDPAGPSRPSLVSVWTESTMSSAGAERVRRREDAAEVRRGEHLDRRPPRGRRPAPAGRRAGGAARPTPRRWRTSTGRPAPAWRRTPAADLQHERGLADARLAAEQHQRARHQAAAQDPVDLADAHRQCGRPARRATSRSATGAWRGAADRPSDRPSDPGVPPGGRASRRANPRRHSGGSGPPIGPSWRRRPGRRTGSPAAPRPASGLDGRLLDERLDGQPGIRRPVDEDRLAGA